VLGLVLVAQIAVVASAPTSAVTCTPFEVSVAARAPGVVPPRIAAPSALQVLQLRSTSRVEDFDNGEHSALTEATFLVAMNASGRATIPPFVASAGAAHGASAPSSVDLRSPDDAQPRVLVRARVEPDRDSVFVGQQLDYVVDVELNTVARSRLRRNPTFFPPEMPGVLAYDLSLPPPPSPVAGARCFESLTYRRALFPLFAGPTTIAPASLTYSLPVSTSFFSREESFELRTDSVRFRAVEPPAAGRPPGYVGAVGQLTASARVASSTARMGDPVVVTLRIEAVGNVKLLPRPAIDLPWASVAIGEERVTVDSTAARVRGAKEFDWLITPRRAGAQAIPAFRYPYFDPERGEYQVAATESLALDVASASLAVSDSAPAARLPIRTALRAERAAPVASRLWFWALIISAPAPALARRLRRRLRRRVRRRSALRSLTSLRASPHVAASDVRRALAAALVERVPALGGGRNVPVARLLRRAGVTDRTADDAVAFLAELDQAAFAIDHPAALNLVDRAIAVARAVDAEAVRPSQTLARSTRAILLIALVSAGAAAAAVPDPLVRAFGEGVAAYTRKDYGTAERIFARVSARAPRAGDAWANLGTSAWARGDSALAAAAWQRALRVDPLDAESRERFAAIQATTLGDPAYVPPMPLDAIALGALVAWLAGWLLLALPTARLDALRSVGGGAIVVALLGFGTMFELQRRSKLSGLGAVRASRSLLAAPVPDAEGVASIVAGEVGALGLREGAWVRITIDGERAGWLPIASILPLDQPLQ